MNLILLLLSSSITSFIITQLTILFYKNKNWLDDPKKSNHPKVIHTQSVPRGGGIPIFLTFIIFSLFLFPIDKHLIGIIMGSLIITITGIFDDIYDLSPKLRLLIGFIAAGCVVSAGIGIPFISNPLNGGIIFLNQPQIVFNLFGDTKTIWIIADIFALFWIVGTMNFVNWSKGLDGQLPGMVPIAAITIAILSQQFSADITQWTITILAIIIAGAYLGFLPWNIFPQKIMPGYGGGALAGYFLAVLSILSTTKVGTLLIVLGLPIVDALFVMIRRILSKKSPLKGDTRHLHHALIKLGWSKQFIAFFYWIITAVLGIIALNINSTQKLYTIILIALGLFTFFIWIKRSNI